MSTSSPPSSVRTVLGMSDPEATTVVQIKAPPASSVPTTPRFITDRATQRRLTLFEVLDQLVTDGLISRTDSAKVIGSQGREQHDIHPLVLIAQQKLTVATPPYAPLSLEKLTAWLADYVQLPYHRIDPLKIDVQKVTGVISHAYAMRYRILPIEVTADQIVVATAEPFLTEWEPDLRHLLRKSIQRVIANPSDIQRYLLEFYGLSRSVHGASAAHSEVQPASNLLNFEQLLELGQSHQLGAEDRPVVQLVDWLLQYAFEQRASDIHLEPRREEGLVRLRIDGLLHGVYRLPPSVMAAVTSRIKILGRMDVAEKRRPQDGRIKTRTPNGREVELRLSTMPTAFGEKCVLRIFDPDIVVKSFAQLGFTPREEALWQHMIQQPHGIVLVTGPTGSGKTTTLYSTLKTLSRPEINICTVEDPIEMVNPLFNQMQVQPNIDLTFAAGIRTLMRQDPDIIMVGEIRDLETAQMAIQAALTGHLVLSTLHTNDATSTITRLLDIGVPDYLIQSTLIGVVAQRLIRTLCPHCKVFFDTPDDIWENLVAPWKIPKPPQVAVAHGCLECRHTGYLGRIGIYEMLRLTPAMRRLIKTGDSQQLRTQAFQDGMQPLRLSAAAHVAAGLTTIEEALTVLPPED